MQNPPQAAGFANIALLKATYSSNRQLAEAKGDCKNRALMLKSIISRLLYFRKGGVDNPVTLLRRASGRKDYINRSSVTGITRN